MALAKGRKKRIARPINQKVEMTIVTMVKRMVKMRAKREKRVRRTSGI